MGKKDRGIISRSQGLIEALPKVGIAVAFVFVFVGLTRGCQDDNNNFVQSTQPSREQYLMFKTITVQPGESSEIIRYIPGKVLETGTPTACVQIAVTGEKGNKTFINCPGDQYRDLYKEIGRGLTVQFTGLKVPAMVSVYVHR